MGKEYIEAYSGVSIFLRIREKTINQISYSLSFSSSNSSNLKERRWRTSRLTVDRQAYVNQCKTVNDFIHQSKMEYFSTLVADHQADPKKLFATAD